MYTVYLILDPDFGEKVLKIADTQHVWLCDTAVNRSAASKYKSKERNQPWNEYGITLYETDAESTKEQIFLDIFGTVDEHHNEYSHDPSWQKLVVIGIDCSTLILSELNAISLGEAKNTPNGFEYLKKL